MIVVAREIVAMLLVVAVGAGVRPLLGRDGVSALSRVAVDVAMPALVVSQLVATTDREDLAGSWPLVVVGGLLLVFGWAVGHLSGDRVAAFLIGLPNWIYLPLPIAAARWGDDGARAVLLLHLGAMPTLWTVGVARLGSRVGARSLATPGLLACVVGGVAVAWSPTVPSALALPLDAMAGALSFLGAAAIPLSLLVTGARASERGWPRADRALVGVVAARLLGVPLLVAAGGALVLRAGLVEDAVAVAVVVLVAAMPVAVSAPPMVERFVGADDLAARAVAASTPMALGTVPLVLWAFDWMREA